MVPTGKRGRVTAHTHSSHHHNGAIGPFYLGSSRQRRMFLERPGDARYRTGHGMPPWRTRMGEWTAIDDLIRRASDPAASAESLQEAIGPVFATFSPGDRAGAEAVLRRLAEEAVDAPTPPNLART